MVKSYQLWIHFPWNIHRAGESNGEALVKLLRRLGPEGKDTVDEERCLRLFTFNRLTFTSTSYICFSFSVFPVKSCYIVYPTLEEWNIKESNINAIIKMLFTQVKVHKCIIIQSIQVIVVTLYRGELKGLVDQMTYSKSNTQEILSQL